MTAIRYGLHNHIPTLPGDSLVTVRKGPWHDIACVQKDTPTIVGSISHGAVIRISGIRQKERELWSVQKSVTGEWYHLSGVTIHFEGVKFTNTSNKEISLLLCDLPVALRIDVLRITEEAEAAARFWISYDYDPESGTYDAVFLP